MTATATPRVSGVVRRRAGWRAPLLLFLALFAIFALTSTRGVASIDVHAPAVEAWRIASAGTPWLEDALPDRSIPENPFLHEVPNGHVVADRMAGPVLISVPFYWLLDHGGGKGTFSLVPAGLAAAFATAGTGCLMFLALRRRLGELLGVTVALTFALATPTWTVSADGPWTHTVTQLGLAGAACGASRRSWWLAGLFLAVGMTGRPHLALVAVVLGLGMSWSTRSLRPALQVALPTVTALGLLLLWNRWMFGVWAVASAGYAGHGTAALGGPVLNADLVGFGGHLRNDVGFLVAPDRGLLVWTPVLLVLAPAVVRAWSGLPDWSRWLAAGGLLYTVVQLQMNVFGGGDGFYGYRLGLELLTCLVPMVGFAVPSLGRFGRVAASLAVAMQAAVITLGAAVVALSITRERSWTDNAFVMAVRALPAALVAWMLLFGLLGLLLPALVGRWAAGVAAPVDGYRRDHRIDD